MQHLIHVVQELQGFLLTAISWLDGCSAKPRHRFVYQWPDIVKMYELARFDQTIPCGSRVMSIFTN